MVLKGKQSVRLYPPPFLTVILPSTSLSGKTGGTLGLFWGNIFKIL